MFVRKRTSKKAKKGYTWTVYIDYEDSYGVLITKLIATRTFKLNCIHN